MFHMVHLIRPDTLTTTPNQLQLMLSITACGNIQNTTLTICMYVHCTLSGGTLSEDAQIAAVLPASIMVEFQAA